MFNIIKVITFSYVWIFLLSTIGHVYSNPYDGIVIHVIEKMKNSVEGYHKILDISQNLVEDQQFLKSHSEDVNRLRDKLKQLTDKSCDIIFLIDSSSTIGQKNFLNIIRFLKFILIHFSITYNDTRISIITFSENISRPVDYISRQLTDYNKCKLFQEELPNIALSQYIGRGTYTLGALRAAKDVFRHSRNDSEKVIILISDGFSNGGDPRHEAKVLASEKVVLFTFGIKNGNINELRDIASEPENCFFFDSYEHMELLAKQIFVLSERNSTLNTILSQPFDSCNSLCKWNDRCCDANAKCVCSPESGVYSCLCNEGYYGSGLREKCFGCSDYQLNSDQIPNNCKKRVQCKSGYTNINGKCEVLKCPKLSPPKNGFFSGECGNVYNAACGVICKPGYQLHGSSIRMCTDNGSWNGEESKCIVKKCPKLSAPRYGTMNCSENDFIFETVCSFTCNNGYNLIGSRKRTCLAISMWDGLPVICRPNQSIT